MMQSYAIFCVLFAAGNNFATAIECNFQYEVDNNSQQSTPLSRSSKNFKRVTRSSEYVFECEDPFDVYEEIININVTSRVKPSFVDMRFGNDDEYESVGSDCVSTKKNITPKSLNNVYNKLMKVVNNATFVQQIEIDECRNKNEPCNNGVTEPFGKKLLCRQKYVKIMLKAFKGEGNEIVDEMFYYPSNCICELVQKKRST